MNIVKAGAEELIWIVVGIFWVIAQIAGGAAKKKMAPPRPVTDEEGEPEEDPFADLMRKLSGVQEFQIPEPPQPKEVKAESPWTPGDIEKLPDVKPTKLEPIVPELVAKHPNVAEVDIRPTMSSFRSVMPAMKLPSMKLSFQGSEKSTGNVPTLGKIINPADKSTLRRAMLSHIIFSPPKALDG